MTYCLFFLSPLLVDSTVLLAHCPAASLYQQHYECVLNWDKGKFALPAAHLNWLLIFSSVQEV